MRKMLLFAAAATKAAAAAAAVDGQPALPGESGMEKLSTPIIFSSTPLSPERVGLIYERAQLLAPENVDGTAEI